MIKVKFWIKSNRGTDEEEIVRFKNNTPTCDIKQELEDWCSTFGAWTHGDNIVNYGYKKIKKKKAKK